MSNCVELSDQWEVVARHGNYNPVWMDIVGNVLIGLLTGGTAGGSTPLPNSVTLTVRHKTTGVTRAATAHCEREAITKINNGQFDGASASLSLRDARREEAERRFAPPRLRIPRLPL